MVTEEVRGVDMVHTREVLDHGRVTLIDYMGSDSRILESARISTGSAPSKGEVKDRGLIRYLYKNGHLTPFEQVTTTWRIKLPIFVARQWMRSRTQSFNEMSARYTELPEEYYTPTDFRIQAIDNHQGSTPGGDFDESLLEDYKDTIQECYDHYHDLLENGVAREHARMVLPVSQYTEFYTTMNLRNLFHFLALRLDDHAQYEIRVYGEAMLDILKEIQSLTWSVEVFEEFHNLEQAYRGAINRVGKDTSGLLNTLINFER